MGNVVFFLWQNHLLFAKVCFYLKGAGVVFYFLFSSSSKHDDFILQLSATLMRILYPNMYMIIILFFIAITRNILMSISFLQCIYHTLYIYTCRLVVLFLFDQLKWERIVTCVFNYSFWWLAKSPQLSTFKDWDLVSVRWLPGFIQHVIIRVIHY